ncbi:Asp23/Gls24 family envelope stress response protein [Curtobacterium ammoniigenes]|uniref:Asp23/Gls24 family envelope stress response protein n=1 Tax=Curtobacterium ammoniigenes TaxID=395387 RepID=UPI0009F99094
MAGATNSNRNSTTATAFPEGSGAQPRSAAPAMTRGRTIVEDAVVAKVAGIAAREVPGVFALGGNAARAFGALRDAIGSSDFGQGVRVEVGETQAAVDLTIVVDYPVPMLEVASAVREAVARAVTELVGLEVTEVNVAIHDVNIPHQNDALEGRRL